VALLAAPLALSLGILLAARTSAGLAATVALIYAPLIFFNLPVALILWVPLTFMTSLHFAWSGPAVISVMLMAAWIGTLPATRPLRAAVIARQRFLAYAIALFLLWSTMSLLWATDTTRGLEALVDWLVAAGIFLVIATTISTARHVRLVLMAFVLGGVASVIVGFATTGLHPAASAIVSASQTEGRLTGGSGDPNYLAAGLVASVVLAGALLATARRPAVRLSLVGAIVVLLAGAIATESRGALLASLGASIAAFVLFKRRRLAVGGFLLTLLALATLWLAADPVALHRITNFNGGGTGRSDLWRVAWRVASHKPVIGVGLDNFVTQEAQYVREPGSLTSVALIADKPHVVHNLYLQSFTETGAIGFGLLMALLLAVLRSGTRAAHRFDEHGQTDLATLARAVVIAQLSIFIALFFLSDGPDERFWVLFGVSGALLGIAPQRPARTTASY
jgi:O-antigen ligase